MYKLSIIAMIMMFAPTLAFSSEISDPEAVFQEMFKAYEKLKDYKVQFEYVERKGKKDEVRVCDFWFMKPDYQRLKVLKGEDAGSSVAYNPTKNRKRVAVKQGFIPVPGGLAKDDERLEGFFDSSWKSDMDEIYRLTRGGIPRLAGSEKLGDRTAYIMEFTRNKEDYTKIKVWIDKKDFLLLQYEYYKSGEFNSRKTWGNIVVDSGLRPDDFKP